MGRTEKNQERVGKDSEKKDQIGHRRTGKIQRTRKNIEEKWRIWKYFMVQKSTDKDKNEEDERKNTGKKTERRGKTKNDSRDTNGWKRKKRTTRRQRRRTGDDRKVLRRTKIEEDGKRRKEKR